ncbi:integral membrane sensor signal transduction histidine kinase [Ancylobacter novellus DSM 506]|uniref:histidine kinase n=1 Tax=Ancylobacter novellus (strain ATCC 8093 / DSM 506 / JCM 20403 / CCM 1077 / IAM 12100 / NBRC 12443 / NCIMB 10456) TaxID=639283 RepID=D7A3J4_ANCN5|nr:integral membrane sensor signal transduction histidine kinase [Ancylobacter novellus DSM 506]
MVGAARERLRLTQRRMRENNARFGAWFNRVMPKGLFARSLIIIITPMVILQSVLAFVFMERHYNTVTRRLSAAVSQDVTALADLAATFPTPEERERIKRIAQIAMGLTIDFLPDERLPPPGPKPFFSILDSAFTTELGKRLRRPFWTDTVGNSNLIEVRVQLEGGVMRVFARRSQAYLSNSHIFLVWMVGTSLVLLFVAILFLRNQIKPIEALADAAVAFGKGRDVVGFRPRGAREVRGAALAFLEMKRRIERQIEQRTTMLAGVSHDMRTILTRFKLELALIGDTPDTEALRKDVDELQSMLEAYLAFARDDTGETPVMADVGQLLDEVRYNAERHGAKVAAGFTGDPMVMIRLDAFRRCVTNLVNNARRHGTRVEVAGSRDERWLTVTVDDDGPGIPPERRDDVFRPFVRLDEARNQDAGGSGLGLTIARDAARSHGGDVILGDSPLGGLRATVRIPV